MDNNKKVRWAILGAGRIAHQFAKDFSAVKNAELVAVASRDVERAKEFASEYNIPQACNYEELYNSYEVDAIYIATPHTLHFEQSAACIKHGKAVLCEKPATINDREFKELAALAKAKQVFLMEALWTYFLPAMQKAKEWIAAGKIGAVKMIQADFGYRMEYEPDGRMYNPNLAGGALLDLGIYPIAFSTFFINDNPVEIKASSRIGKTNVDESTGIIIQYPDATAILHCSILSTTLTTGYIFGDKGFIELPQFYKAGTANLFNGSNELTDTFADGRSTIGYNYEIQEATNCILAGNTESIIVHHIVSNRLQEIMTESRRQVGLKYPAENEI